MLKIPYKQILIIAVIINILLQIFADKTIGRYSPIMFWLVAGVIIFNMVWILQKLAVYLKTNNSQLYDKHRIKNSIGLMGISALNASALNNSDVIKALDEKHKELAAEWKALIKYFIICFILFSVSGLLTVIRTWFK